MGLKMIEPRQTFNVRGSLSPSPVNDYDLKHILGPTITPLLLRSRQHFYDLNGHNFFFGCMKILQQENRTLRNRRS